jgi:uncharacterized protein YybS (DUF2232 family)
VADRGPVPARAGAGADNRVSGILGSGTFAATVFAASALLPPLAPVALVSPLPLALQRLRGGSGSAVLATALAVALVAAVATPQAATWFAAALVAPVLLLGESLARGRGLLRGCAWAFALLVLEVAIGLVFAGDAMASASVAPFEQLRSDAFLAQLKQGGVPPETVADFAAQAGEMRDVVAVVFPAVWIIGAALVVLANAALLRLYLLRRDPGWLEDGEFERARLPLALVAGFILSGAAVAVPVLRPYAYNVLLVVAFFFALQGTAVVAFYARRLAAPPLLRLAVLVLVLANPWAPQILALLGLFDNWFDFRKWAEPPRPTA